MTRKFVLFSVNGIFNIKYNGKIINLKNKIWKILHGMLC